MSRVADIVRRDMFTNDCPPFNGTFTDDCQQRSVPSSLLTLVSMILHGSSIMNEVNYQSQAALSLSQLLLHNSVRHMKTESTDTRHSRDREPPLPLFLGAYVHSKTRSKDMIKTLHKMGLSVSYDRVLLMSADLANSAINHFDFVGAVCPQSLKMGIFTTSAVDNIDHDPTSTSAHTSFHGTGISLFQHPDVLYDGIDQARAPLSKSNRVIAKLPNNYTSVPAVVAIKAPSIPEINELKKPNSIVDVAVENQWCQHVCDVISAAEDLDHPNNESTLNETENKHVSWAAYHATNQSENSTPTAISTLLPLFPDDSKSLSMIKHSMDVVQQAVHTINQGQTPIITCDQPLYKLAKDIQWKWPETHGEDSFVVMLGGGGVAYQDDTAEMLG